MRLYLPLLLALLLSALPVSAAPIDDARGRHVEAQAAFTQLDGERAALAAQNERLAAEIAAAKEAVRPPLLPGGQLDGLLKNARDLAMRLEALDRDAAAARARLEAARTALVGLLDGEIDAARRALPGLTGAAQRAEFERLRALAAERDALRTSLAAPGRKVELPAVADAGDASSDELRELADEARDHAETIQARLAALEERLQSLQARRRLVRAAQAFVRDEALFGEGERTRRVVRVDRDALGAGAAGPDSARNPDPPVAAVDGRAGGGPAAEPAGASRDDDQAPPPPEAGGGAEFAEGDAPGAENDFDGQASGAGDPADPAAVPDEPAAPPEPVGEIGVAGDLGTLGDSSAGAPLVVDEAFDPGLVVGDVDDLSPQALAEHIKRVEAKREALRRTARALEERRRELERRAQQAEGAEGQ